PIPCFLSYGDDIQKARCWKHCFLGQGRPSLIFGPRELIFLILKVEFSTDTRYFANTHFSTLFNTITNTTHYASSICHRVRLPFGWCRGKVPQPVFYVLDIICGFAIFCCLYYSLRALIAAAVASALSASAPQRNARQPDINVASIDPTFAADRLATMASSTLTLSSPETLIISVASKVRSTARSLAEPEFPCCLNLMQIFIRNLDKSGKSVQRALPLKQENISSKR
ncbi:unnamed protein product, partial [Clonostachys solani]